MDTTAGQPLASLEGTAWRLVGGELTIAFAAGRASGSGGCNRFAAAYNSDGAAISFGPLAATRMACAHEVMEAEQAYFAALAAVSTWSATDDELMLSNDDGEVLLRYEVSSA